jgi:type I restriction enzyme S subunit
MMGRGMRDVGVAVGKIFHAEAQRGGEAEREMRDSGVDWIGKIPEGWEVNFLSQKVSQVKNRNDGLKEKNLLSLSYGKIKRKSIDSIGGLLPASFEGYNVIAADDIVLRLTDLQNDQHSLRVGLSRERGIVTSAYTTIRPNFQTDAIFLFYSLFAFDIVKGFYGMGSGVRQGLNYDEVKRMVVAIPPLAEQKAIAEYLDEKCAAIDAAVAEAKKGIEEYKAWKKSLIFEAVTGKRRVGAFNAETQSRREAEKMKPSGIPWIGEIPVGWRVMKLKHLIDILPGYAFKSEDFNFANGIRLLRGINVGVDNLRWDECVYWNRVISEDLAGYQIQAGDLIVG